jgi:hypothetical protein
MQETRYFQLKDVTTKNCADITDESLKVNAKLIQWNCKREVERPLNQWFSFSSKSGLITNAMSGHCLRVKSKKKGEIVTQGHCAEGYKNNFHEWELKDNKVYVADSNLGLTFVPNKNQYTLSANPDTFEFNYFRSIKEQDIYDLNLSEEKLEKGLKYARENNWLEGAEEDIDFESLDVFQRLEFYNVVTSAASSLNNSPLPSTHSSPVSSAHSSPTSSPAQKQARGSPAQKPAQAKQAKGKGSSSSQSSSDSSSQSSSDSSSQSSSDSESFSPRAAEKASKKIKLNNKRFLQTIKSDKSTNFSLLKKLFANGEGEDEERRAPSAGRLFVTQNNIAKNEIPFCFSVTLEEKRTIVLEGFFNRNRYSFQFSDQKDLPMSKDDKDSENAFGGFHSIVLREGVDETDIKDTSIYELKAFGTEKVSTKPQPMIIFIHFEMRKLTTKELEKVTLICEIFDDTNTAKVRLVNFRPIFKSKLLPEIIRGTGQECKREDKKRISIRSRPNPRRKQKDSDSDSDTGVAVGMRVKVFGLLNDPEFNGLKGIIHSDNGDESFDVKMVVDGVMKMETFDQKNLKVVKRKKSKLRAAKEPKTETPEERNERLKEKKQRIKKRNDLIYEWENKEKNGYQFNDEETKILEKYERMEKKRVKKEELKAAAKAAANADAKMKKDSKNQLDFDKLYNRILVLKMKDVSNDIISEFKKGKLAEYEGEIEVVDADVTRLSQDKIAELLTLMRKEIKKKEDNMLRKFNKMFDRVIKLQSDTLLKEINQLFKQNGGFDANGRPNFSNLNDAQRLKVLKIQKKLENAEEEEREEKNAEEVDEALRAKTKTKTKKKEEGSEGDFSDDEDYLRFPRKK